MQQSFLLSPGPTPILAAVSRTGGENEMKCCISMRRTMLLVACLAVLMTGAKVLNARYAKWQRNRALVKEVELNLMPCSGIENTDRAFFAAKAMDGGRSMVRMLLKSVVARNQSLAGAFLARLGDTAGPAVPELIEVLRSGGNVCEACYILSAIGPKAGSSAPALVECLAADDPYHRAAAVQALGQVGVRSDRVRRAVAAKLNDTDVDVRLQAAKTAWCLGMDAEPCVRTLVAVLEKVDGEHARQYRNEALDALGEIGKPAESAVPAIQKILKHEPLSQDCALLALLRIRGPADGVLQALLLKLREQPLHVIRPIMAKTLLMESNESRDVVVEAFGKLLDTKNGPRTLGPRPIFQSICQLGRQGTPLIPLVRASLKDTNPLTRQYACVALTAFGKGSDELVTQLEDMATSDKSLYVRLQANDAATRLRETLLH